MGEKFFEKVDQIMYNIRNKLKYLTSVDILNRILIINHSFFV